MRKSWYPSTYFYGLIFLALLFYNLPCVTTPGVSLSLGLYDAANWASLHPAVRASSPPFLTSLQLRLPLACTALLVAFWGSRVNWWLPCLFVLGLALAQLPPLEFFTQATNDPNYQQQLALAVVTIIGGIIGLSGWQRRRSQWIIRLIALLGGSFALIGSAQVYQLVLTFHIPAQVGLGGIVTALVFAALIIATWPVQRQQATG